MLICLSCGLHFTTLLHIFFVLGPWKVTFWALAPRPLGHLQGTKGRQKVTKVAPQDAPRHPQGHLLATLGGTGSAQESAKGSQESTKDAPRSPTGGDLHAILLTFFVTGRKYDFYNPFHAKPLFRSLKRPLFVPKIVLKSYRITSTVNRFGILGFGCLGQQTKKTNII